MKTTKLLLLIRQKEERKDINGYRYTYFIEDATTNSLVKINNDGLIENINNASTTIAQPEAAAIKMMCIGGDNIQENSKNLFVRNFLLKRKEEIVTYKISETEEESIIKLLGYNIYELPSTK